MKKLIASLVLASVLAAGVVVVNGLPPIQPAPATEDTAGLPPIQPAPPTGAPYIG